ncbi:hypothetical protein KEM56_005276 [Ascosphaera pollenicola]|nr:hypothetical protein KEM56_005276 [Ascosphaera pollenicola]
MPSLLQSRKSKAEMKKSQDGQPPPKTSTFPPKAAQQPPEKERFEAGSTHPEKMSPSKNTGTEHATEPFPAFEDTPVIIDAQQQSRSAVKYMGHAKLGGNGEATGFTFSPTHPFMSRERHRQISDEGEK